MFRGLLVKKNKSQKRGYFILIFHLWMPEKHLLLLLLLAKLNGVATALRSAGERRRRSRRRRRSGSLSINPQAPVFPSSHPYRFASNFSAYAILGCWSPGSSPRSQPWPFEHPWVSSLIPLIESQFLLFQSLESHHFSNYVFFFLLISWWYRVSEL